MLNILLFMYMHGTMLIEDSVKIVISVAFYSICSVAYFITFIAIRMQANLLQRDLLRWMDSFSLLSTFLF